MCTLCRALPLSTPYTAFHVNMAPITEPLDCGEAGIRCLYRCSICWTHWLYQQDKWQSCIGFKLWTGDLESYQANYPTSSPARSQIVLARITKGHIR